MKLKENEFLKEKGLDLSASWTKVINFMFNHLTNEELKNVLFSVEQTTHKRNERRYIKCFKKNSKNTKYSDDHETSLTNVNSDTSSEANGSRRVSNSFLNEENDCFSGENSRKRKEEDKIMLEKFLKCFNSNSEELLLNTSFEEEEENKENNEYSFINPLNNKSIINFNNPLIFYK